MENQLKSYMFLLLVTALLSFSACSSSGGGSLTPPPPTTYTIGGTVINLAGTGGGLVLQDNGGDNLPVNANLPRCGQRQKCRPGLPAGAVDGTAIKNMPPMSGRFFFASRYGGSA